MGFVGLGCHTVNFLAFGPVMNSKYVAVWVEMLVIITYVSPTNINVKVESKFKVNEIKKIN